MAKKGEICGLHCPKWMLWAFAALGAWFTLSALDVPTFGGFWSWAVLLSGTCSIICATNATHKKTSCPFAGIPVWFGVLLSAIGAWFVLGDAGLVSTFNINLLYVVTFVGALGLLWYRK
jgi:hypothetical protein